MQPFATLYIYLKEFKSHRGIYYAKYYGGGGGMATGKKMKNEGAGGKNEKGEGENVKIASKMP